MLPENVQKALSVQLARFDVTTILRYYEDAVEYMYQKLPSGDYGRGDVRRYIDGYLRAWGFTRT